MGKKKSPQRPPNINIFVLRGTEEFRTWMTELAIHVGSPVTVMVERALRDLAKKEGFATPPRRIR